MNNRIRNVQLDFFKIVFTILVVIHHSPYYTVRGYIAVEYFFIVSGYFTIQTFEKNREMSTRDYLKKRLKILYPHYIFSLFIMYLGVKQFEACKLDNLKNLIPDIFLLQNVGIFKGGGINYPAWYMSVLITGSMILFFLYKQCPIKMYNCVAILCVVTVYCYLFHCGEIEVWNKFYFFYIPWWRGTAALCIGSLIYQMSNKLNKYIMGYHITEIICTAILVVCIFTSEVKILDFLAVFCLVVLVTVMTTPYSIYQNLPSTKLSRYEYAIYLNHAFCIGVTNKLFTVPVFDNIDIKIRLVILLLTTIIYSVITTHIVEWLVRKWHVCWENK